MQGIGIADPVKQSYLRRETGFPYISPLGGEGIQIVPSDRIFPPAEAQLLRQLVENEYIACMPTGSGAPNLRLYCRDGAIATQLEDKRILLQETAWAGTGGEPFRALEAAFGLALLAQHALVAHALVFEYQGKGYLAFGDGGAGKTTLALAVILAGGRVVTDDRVLLTRSARATQARCFRPFLRFRQTSLQALARHVELPAWVEKGIEQPDGALRVNFEQIDQHNLLPEVEVSTMFLMHSAGRSESTRVRAVHAGNLVAWMLNASCPHYFVPELSAAGVDWKGDLVALTDGISPWEVVVGTRLLSSPVEEFYSLLAQLD